MHRGYIAGLAILLCLPPALAADQTAAQVFAGLPAWPAHADKAGCAGLRSQAQSLAKSAGAATQADNEGSQRASDSMKTSVQNQYGGQIQQNQQSAQDVATRMKALQAKYPGNPMAMMADPEFQALTHQAQGVGEQSKTMGQQISTSTQPQRDVLNQAGVKYQQLCGGLDFQSQTLQARIKTQATAARTRAQASIQADLKACPQVIGEAGEGPSADCAKAVGARHKPELDAAADSLFKSTAPDYARYLQAAQQCAAGMDPFPAHSAEKWSRAEQAVQVESDACEAAIDVGDVLSY